MRPFTISAWAPDGRRVIRLPGPLGRGYLREETHVRWTAGEVALLQDLYQAGRTTAEIACILWRTRKSVQHKLRRKGIR